MHCRIASDIPGRLSLRCDPRLIDADEARGIAVALMAIPGVSYAEVHERSGCILAECRQEARDDVLAALDALDPLDLPSLPPDSVEVPYELEASLENNRFAIEAAGMVFWHLVRRVVLPPPVAAAYTVFQALRFVRRGLASLARGELTVDVLDATAISASIARGAFRDASTVMLLLRLTEAMERHVHKRVRIALAENLITRPETVWTVTDEGEAAIPIGQVGAGMVLRLGAGQVLPVDGVVVDGSGSVNEAPMTGEPGLVLKDLGATVYAGTALESGELRVRVTAPPGKSRIDGIAAMVDTSSSLKADIQGDAERLADSLVPLSLAAFVGLLAVTRSLRTAMAVLMVDYSCAVRLTTPISIMTAMGEASRCSMVVKGGKFLEAFAHADTIVFDKTGTLTNACPSVVNVMTFGDVDPDEILRYAACIEEHFPHSVARAIVEECVARGLDHRHELHAKVDYVVAHGIKTEVSGRAACIGSAHFVFEDEGMKKPRGLAARIRKEARDASVVYLALDGKVEGAICVSDPLRLGAASVIGRLRELGFEHVVMLTGDAEGSAKAVARELGIDEYQAQMLPEQKSEFVRSLRDEGHTVVMVGDGINDSPALAAADVSVALSDASDIARAVADISILDDSLEGLATLRELSQRTMKRIGAGYRAIVGINTTLIVLGVSGAITLTTASFLHNVSTLALAVADTRPYL